MRFIPIDIPKFHFKQKVLDEFNPNTKFYWWSEEYITEWDIKEILHDPPKMRNVHLELQEHIEKYLPFDSITLCKLSRANIDVDAHVDDSYTSFKGPKDNCKLISEEYRQHQLKTEPCGYRILIEGDRTSLYLSDGEPDVINQKLIYSNKTYTKSCIIPETTDCFALQSYGSMHGVNKTPGDDNRLLCFIIGWLNEEKHNELIKRSEERFKDYVHYA